MKKILPERMGQPQSTASNPRS